MGRSLRYHFRAGGLTPSALAEKMPLHVRTWTHGCGTTHDRDVNAARNLLVAGLAVSALEPV